MKRINEIWEEWLCSALANDLNTEAEHAMAFAKYYHEQKMKKCGNCRKKKLHQN